MTLSLAPLTMEYRPYPGEEVARAAIVVNMSRQNGIAYYDAIIAGAYEVGEYSRAAYLTRERQNLERDRRLP